MTSKNDFDIRKILIIEDDEVFINTLVRMCRDALSPLRISIAGTESEEADDIHLIVAKTPEEAKNALRNRNVYLATVDINLKGAVYRDVAREGMEILEEIYNFYSHVCPIVISSEDPGLHMRNALRKYDAIDYVQKTELRSKKTEITNLFKTTFIYAEAIRLFKEGSWSQAELIWQTLNKEIPEFVEDNDTKNLGKRFNDKKCQNTGLPGQEWIWMELDLLRKDISRSDWAIIIVDIENFKSFQDRSPKGAEDVLKIVAQELKNIKDVIGYSHPSISDLLSWFQQSNNKKSIESVFLGEVDNTGRFVLVTPSLKIAQEIKKAIDEKLTPETLRKFHPYEEQKSGYVIVNGQKVDLMTVMTNVRTFDDIMVDDRSDNREQSLPVDVFEKRIFGHLISETSPENQITNETLHVDSKKEKKKRFIFF